MASTSRVSEKSLSLQPMNSNNYTAAQDGVQSLTHMHNPDNIVSPSGGTSVNQGLGNSLETGNSDSNHNNDNNNNNNIGDINHSNKSNDSNNEIHLRTDSNGQSDNDNNQTNSVTDTVNDLSKLSLNSARLSRGSNSPLNSSFPKQTIQTHQQFQDYPPIPIQRFSPSNSSHGILQNSPNSPKLMSSLTNSFSTRLNSPTIPFEDKLPNGGGNNIQAKRNKSPFRDSSNGYVKQIKTQRRPLYTPAVLRVTENATSNSLPLNHSDSTITSDPLSSNETDSPPPSFSTNVPPQRPNLPYRKSSSSSVRSNSSSVLEYASDYLNVFANKFLNPQDSNSELNSGPTRSHWKSNNSRFSCSNCNRIFNYLSVTRRRHHCRYCGDIFCSDCLNNFIYLNKDAKFVMIGGNTEEEEEAKDPDNANNTNPNHNLEDKFLSKSCHNCFLKYEEFLKQNSQDIIDANDTTAGNGLNKDKNKNSNKNLTTPTATNIPVDWDWSSF